MLAIAWVLLRQSQWSFPSPLSQSVATTPLSHPTVTPILELGERHQLNYQQWVALLEQEAQVIAEQKPEHLAVLLGDSISLWFPNELLPPDQKWLNQGISG
ncbi:MAG TPA: lysophospholipase, partial [Cyanobacteria bacterium UBA11370]|nr:lysophospholipase [Cyanobacteria bacterium UBA11370]